MLRRAVRRALARYDVGFFVRGRSGQGLTELPVLVAGRSGWFHVDAEELIAGQQRVAVLAGPAVHCHGALECDAAGVGLVFGHLESGGQLLLASGFQGDGNGKQKHLRQVRV